MSSSPVRFGVVVFPGSNCDADAHHAVSTFPGTSVHYLSTTDTPFTSACETGDLLRIVVKHNEGNYTVDADTLARMKAADQIVLRYVSAAGERAEGANPNGALDDIAGVCNEARNVFGMMPHPENSVEAELAGGVGGRKLFQSIIDTVLRTAEVAS